MQINVEWNAGWKVFCVLTLAVLLFGFVACGPDQQEGKSSKRERKEKALESGTEFTAAFAPGQQVESQTIDQTREVLLRRLKALDLDKCKVEPVDDKLRIRIPRVFDLERVKRLLFTRFALEFRFAYKTDDPNLDRAMAPEQLIDAQGGTLPEGTEIVPRIELSEGQVGEIAEYLLLEKESHLDASHIKKASTGPSESEYGGFVVFMSLTDEGGEIMRSISAPENFGRLLAIVIDGRCVMAASIYGEISADVQLSGNLDETMAKDLALLLNAGTLPVKLEIESESSFGEDEDEGEASELPETIWPF